MASDTINKSGTLVTIDATKIGARAIYDVRGLSYFSFHVFSPGNAWVASTLKVRYGNTAADFQDVGSAVTFTAFGMTDILNVIPVAYVCLEVTSIAASTFAPTIVGYGQ